MPGARSISMNSYVGNPTRTYNGSTKYALCNKLPQVMSPASMFVTLDEHSGTINDGCFFTAPEILYQLVDYPAAYHANGWGFSFADGHSEIHKWQDLATCPPPSGYLLFNVNLPGDKDVLWLSQHAIGAASYP
jgi:hypothetical protein